MKILQIGPIPPEIGGKTTGGVATHVWGLSTHLAKRRHQVAILADNFFNPLGIPVVKDGVRIYGLSKALILKHLPSILPNLSTIYRLKNHLKGLIGTRGIAINFCYYDYVLHRFKPDVIHVHHLETRFAFAFFASKAKIPVVTTIHSFSSIEFSPPVQSQRYHKLVANNLRLSRNLIFVSHYLEKECTRLFGDDYTAERWVIHNPADVGKYHPVDKDEARQRMGLPKEVLTLLFVGNLVARKGVYTLLEAAKILKKKLKLIKVIIVGDGPEREGIEDFVANNDLKDLVRLEGIKGYPELLYYYNSADLFVMPSFSEGFSLVYVEALNCGIPIIGCSGVADEVIQSNEYGLLVPSGNVGSLSEGIEKGLSKKWNKAEVLAYAKSFDWDINMHKFEEVYNALLNANGNRPNTVSSENVLPKKIDIANRDDFVLSYCKSKKILHLGAVDSEFLEAKINRGTLFHLKLMSDPQIKSVIGIDIDQKGIEILRKYNINNVIHGNLERLNEVSLDEKFDIIMAGEIIEHLSNPGMFLQGTKKFFHESTEMIITTPNPFSYIRFHHVMINKEIVHPDHKCWYSYITLRNLLQTHGFKVTKVLLYSYRDIKLINRFSPRILLNRSVLLRKIFYRVNPFFADGLIFVVKLNSGSH